MMLDYFRILLFIIIGASIGGFLLTLAYFIAPRKYIKAKLRAYECGFEQLTAVHIPFNVKYYIVALLFILFDLEIAFLIPWAIVFRKMSWQAIIPMAIFLLFLVIGFVYEIKKGVLEWD